MRSAPRFWGLRAGSNFINIDSDKAFDAVRDDVDDVFFLSASEIVDQDLAGKVAPGPTVFNEQTAVMVAGASPYRGLSDLARQPLCYLMGDSAERHRNAWFREHGLDFIHQAYQEEVELYGTFNVQVCKGLAAEITTLAAVRLSAGEKDFHSRILGEPLAVFPIFATTGTRDGQWSAIVAWAIELAARRWRAGRAVIHRRRRRVSDQSAGTGTERRSAETRRQRGGELRRHLSAQSRRPLAPQTAAWPERSAPRRRTVRATLPRIGGAKSRSRKRLAIASLRRRRRESPRGVHDDLWYNYSETVEPRLAGGAVRDSNFLEGHIGSDCETMSQAAALLTQYPA